MTKTVVLISFLCLAIPLVSQEVGKPQTQTQCKFSDGSSIEITHIFKANTYELATDEDLLTARGMSVPAGHYAVLPTRDSRNSGWTLTMRDESAKGEYRELTPVPMSVVQSVQLKRYEALPATSSFTVSFEQTGGSCMMHWRADKPNVVLSLEFTKKNTDLPLAQ